MYRVTTNHMKRRGSMSRHTHCNIVTLEEVVVGSNAGNRHGPTAVSEVRKPLEGGGYRGRPEAVERQELPVHYTGS